MILKFIQAETMQPILIMRDAITSVAVRTDSTTWIYTVNGVCFTVLGTVEQIHEALDRGGFNTMAIAPIG